MSTRARTVLVIAAVAVLALAVAGRGMGDIPLDSHEIYVAQTAENMMSSGDWLVPRLNGEYRLTKPPLSYWLVAGAAWVSGHDQVSPTLARLPSVLAVAGVALLALWLGARLFDGRTGVLASLLCLASVAAFKYGHNARPDMVYAFWTTVVLAAWCGGWQTAPDRQARWALSLWLAVGLATLTKGPQAPAILLLGLTSHALICGERMPALWRRLCPLRGLLVVLIMVVPWYLLLRHAIGGQALGNSQLSGSLLRIDPWRVFTPFYLLRTPVLWLPWALLLPAALHQAWRGRTNTAGMLGFVIVFAMLAFALGPQYRQIYMLPWLVPAMLLFAAAIVRLSWTRHVLALIGALLVAALGWLLYQVGLAALATVGVVAGLLATAFVTLRQSRNVAAAVLLSIAFALELFQGGGVPALWSSARYQELAFTRALRAHIDSGMPIVVWDIDPAHYSYYLDRPVRGFEALDAVCSWVDRQHVDALVIYPRARRAELDLRLTVVPVTGVPDSEFKAALVSAGQACSKINATRA